MYFHDRFSATCQVVAALQLARELALALMQALLPVLSLALAPLPTATSAPALLLVLLLMLALALARALAGPINVCASLHLCVSVFMLLCVTCSHRSTTCLYKLFSGWEFRA
jgi:hypothetical protein